METARTAEEIFGEWLGKERPDLASLPKDGLFVKGSEIDKKHQEVDLLRKAFMAGHGTQGEAMIDEKNYTVTWATGRRGNLTRQEADAWVTKIEEDWKRFGCRGRPDTKIWYRDGSLVEAVL